MTQSFSLFLFVVSTVVCGNPTPPSGVTVVQPHNTTVSSVILYQCQQSGFAPSPPSSVCVDNGTWSTDPSQVVCRLIPTTTMPSMSPTTATTTTTTATTGEMLVLTGKMKFIEFFS